MRRYVTAWYHDGEWREERRGGPSSLDVFEPEPEPTWSGLYDARGVKIMAVDDRPVMGFLRPNG